MTPSEAGSGAVPCMAFAHIDGVLPHFTSWSMDTTQVESGKTLSTVKTMDVGQLKIVHNCESHTLVHDWRLDPGKTALSFFAPSMANGTWCGFTVHAGDFLVMTDRRDHFATTPAGLDQVVLTVDTNRLDDTGALPFLKGARALIDGSGASRLTPSGMRLTRLLFDLMASRTPVRANAEDDLEGEILSLLADTVQEVHRADTSGQCRNPTSGYATVQRAMTVIKSDKSLKTVGDLAQEMSVSRRTLHLAFQRHVGISPYQLMRNYRLQKIRFELMNAPSGPTLIKQVARSHGFSDLGRFAGYYNRMYGERPSDTLQRSG